MKPDVKATTGIKACFTFDRTRIYCAVNSGAASYKLFPELDISGVFETGAAALYEAVKSTAKSISVATAGEYSVITAALPDPVVSLSGKTASMKKTADMTAGKTVLTAVVTSGSGKNYSETAFAAEKTMIDSIYTAFLERGTPLSAIKPGVICLMDYYDAEIAAKPGILIDVEEDYMTILFFNSQKLPVNMFSKWRNPGSKFTEHLSCAVSEVERKTRAYASFEPDFIPENIYAIAEGENAGRIAVLLKERFSCQTTALKAIKAGADMPCPVAAAVAL